MLESMEKLEIAIGEVTVPSGLRLKVGLEEKDVRGGRGVVRAERR
jgi:hypothetical protein